MVKRLIVTGAAAAMMLASALPAFATYQCWGWNCYPTPEPTTTLTGTVSGNNVVAAANTGMNTQTGGKMQMMKTGDAWAGAYQTNMVNSNECGDCATGYNGTFTGTVKNNKVVALANTGKNTQTAGMVKPSRCYSYSTGGMQMMMTGNAGAEAFQWNVVNSSVSVTP